MDEARLKNRISSMQNSMDVAKYLDSRPPIKVPKNASRALIEKTQDRLGWSSKSVAYMLNAIVLEIAIKVIWELDNGGKCKHTHDISKLFKNLDCTSQSDLKCLFDEKTRLLANLEVTRGETRIRLGELLQFQSWEETLVANRGVMVKFKYDGRFKGKSSAMGSAMWNEDGGIVWMLPPMNDSFLEALCRYTMDRFQKAIQKN